MLKLLPISPLRNFTLPQLTSQKVDCCSAPTSNMPALQSHRDWANRVTGITRMASLNVREKLPFPIPPYNLCSYQALIRARGALPSRNKGLVSTVLRMRQIFTEICEIVNYSVTLRILLHPLRHYYWVELTVVSWILFGCL